VLIAQAVFVLELRKHHIGPDIQSQTPLLNASRPYDKQAKTDVTNLTTLNVYSISQQ